MKHDRGVCLVCRLSERDRHMIGHLASWMEPFEKLSDEYEVPILALEVHLADVRPEIIELRQRESSSVDWPMFESTAALFLSRQGLAREEVLKRRLKNLTSKKHDPFIQERANWFLAGGWPLFMDFGEAALHSQRRAAEFDFSKLTPANLIKTAVHLAPALPPWPIQRNIRERGHVLAAFESICVAAWDIAETGDWEGIINGYRKREFDRWALFKLRRTGMVPIFEKARDVDWDTYKLQLGSLLDKDGLDLQAEGLRGLERWTRFFTHKFQGFSEILNPEINSAIGMVMDRKAPKTAEGLLASLNDDKLKYLRKDIKNYIIDVLRAQGRKKRRPKGEIVSLDEIVPLDDESAPGPKEYPELERLIVQLGDQVCRNNIDRIIWREKVIDDSGRTFDNLAKMIKSETGIELSGPRIRQRFDELSERAKKLLKRSK